MRALRVRFLALAGAFGVAVAIVGGWVSPWGKALRYRRASLVTLKRWLDANPKDRLAWREMGLRLARDGDGALAEPALRQAFALDPGDVEVATGLGEILMARGAVSEAFQVLKAAVGRHPDFAPARMALGRLYRRRGAYHRAAEQFEVVARQRRDYPDAWYELAACYHEMQQVQRATTAIERALQADPNEPEYLTMKAEIFAAVGRVEEAIAALTRAADRAPDSARIQSRLATLLLVHSRGPNDLARAEQAIRRLEHAAPEHPLLPYLYGRRAMLLQKWSEALPHLETARRVTPDQDEVFYALSQVYRRLGRIPDAEDALAEYRRRQTLRRKIDELRIRLAIASNPRPLYERLAELQLRAGDVRGAIASLESALQLAPNDRRLQRRLAAMQSRASAGSDLP